MSIVNKDEWENQSPFFDKTWDVRKTEQSKLGTAFPIDYCGNPISGFDGSISSSRKVMARQGLNKTISPCQGEPPIVSAGDEIFLRAGVNAPVTEHDGEVLNHLTFRGKHYYFGKEGTTLTCYGYEEYIGDNYYTAKMVMKDHNTIGKYKKGFCFATPLSSSPSLLKEPIPSFTVNARLAMIENTDVTDDGGIISESFSKRLSYLTKETIKLSIFNTDVPIKIHDGKWLPEIGQHLKDKTVVAFRRDTPDTVTTDVTDEMMPYYDRPVKTKLENPVVTGIHIFDNRSKVRSTEVFDECVYHIDEIKEEAVTLAKYIRELMNKADLEGLTLSSQLLALYTSAVVASDSENRTAKYGEGGCMFYIEIDLVSINQAGVGTKLNNKGAAKIMVCDVRPDENMPIDANGIPVDLVMEASTVNRMNQGLTHEGYIGSVFYLMLERFRGSDNPIELWDEYIELLSHTRSKQYYSYKDIEDDAVKELIIDEFLLTGTMIVFRMDNYIDAGDVVQRISKSRFALDESGFYDSKTGEFLGEGYTGVITTYMLNKTSYDGSASGSSYTNGISVTGLPNNRLTETSISVKPTRSVSETVMRIDSRTHNLTGLHESVLALTSLTASEEYVKSMVETGKLPESFISSGHIHPKVKQFKDLLLFFGASTKMVKKVEAEIIDREVVDEFVNEISPKIIKAKEQGLIPYLNEYEHDVKLDEELFKEMCFDKTVHVGDNWKYPEQRVNPEEVDKLKGTPIWDEYNVSLNEITHHLEVREDIDDSDKVEPFLDTIGVKQDVKQIIRKVKEN